MAKCNLSTDVNSGNLITFCCKFGNISKILSGDLLFFPLCYIFSCYLILFSFQALGNSFQCLFIHLHTIAIDITLPQTWSQFTLVAKNPRKSEDALKNLMKLKYYYFYIKMFKSIECFLIIYIFFMNVLETFPIVSQDISMHGLLLKEIKA